MEYRRAGNKIIAVLERGEELCAALRALAPVSTTHMRQAPIWLTPFK